MIKLQDKNAMCKIILEIIMSFDTSLTSHPFGVGCQQHRPRAISGHVTTSRDKGWFNHKPYMLGFTQQPTVT